MVQYEVARGAVKLPFPKTASKTDAPRAQFLRQGELVPEGLLTQEEVSSLLREGRIQVLKGSVAIKAAAKRTQNRGKWAVDPETLKNKTLEDLLLLVLGIDEDFDTNKLTTTKAAITQLTKDWDPAFADEVAKSYDNKTPGVSETGVKGVEGGHELSDRAKATLEKAKARAKGGSSETTEGNTTD